MALIEAFNWLNNLLICYEIIHPFSRQQYILYDTFTLGKVASLGSLISTVLLI